MGRWGDGVWRIDLKTAVIRDPSLMLAILVTVKVEMRG
jgi:hypothetical protein